MDTGEHVCRLGSSSQGCARLPLRLPHCSILPTAALPLSTNLQEVGTYHVRTTILPPEQDMAVVSQKIREFHAGFMAKYGGGLPANGGAK